MAKENNFGMYKSSEFILIKKSSKKTVPPWQCMYDTGLCVQENSPKLGRHTCLLKASVCICVRC